MNSLNVDLEDEVTLDAGDQAGTRPHTRLLVYYIAGNPGLIGYYKDFLVQLQKNLKQVDEHRHVILYGASLDGFETRPRSKALPSPPFGLQEQIELTKRRLERKVVDLAGETPPAPMPVILVAHSVGAYILLELLAWWQKQTGQQELYHIVGGICLFPTVVDIAKSQKGRQLSWFLGIPGISLVVQWLARVLALVPLWLWDWPGTLHPGLADPEVTAALIRSQNGVRQVIYMANDEMRMIKANQWPDTLWGIRALSEETANRSLASSAKLKTKLYFYWGGDDYWVDKQIRDGLIAQRASRGDSETAEWPQMRIDRHGIPHTFSLDERHCGIIAAEVAEYVIEVKRSCRDMGVL